MFLEVNDFLIVVDRGKFFGEDFAGAGKEYELGKERTDVELGQGAKHKEVSESKGICAGPSTTAANM